MDPLHAEDRLTLLRKRLAETDADVVDLRDRLRKRVVLDRRELATRVAVLEKLGQDDVDERDLWRLYLSAPRSRLGRALMHAATVIARCARWVG